MSEAKCETCRWFAASEVRNFKTLYRNLCHRWPQSITKTPDNWCGEHSPKDSGHE